jgi:hypothetical protein
MTSLEKQAASHGGLSCFVTEQESRQAGFFIDMLSSGIQTDVWVANAPDL